MNCDWSVLMNNYIVYIMCLILIVIVVFYNCDFIEWLCNDKYFSSYGLIIIWMGRVYILFGLFKSVY